MLQSTLVSLFIADLINSNHFLEKKLRKVDLGAFLCKIGVLVNKAKSVKIGEKCNSLRFFPLLADMNSSVKFDPSKLTADQQKRCSDGLKRLMGPPDSDGWQFHLDTGYCDVTIPIYGVIEAIFVVHF